MIMVRPTFRCGLMISPPLLVMVVKPLKARIEKATDASSASRPESATGSEKAPYENPLAQIAAIANRAMPPILIADIKRENQQTAVDRKSIAKGKRGSGRVETRGRGVSTKKKRTKD